MPDNDRISIDSLTLAPELSSDDVTAVVHTVNGVKSTYKSTMTLLGTFLNKILQYSADLTTTNKTIIGAINEINTGGGGGGAVIRYGTTAPASSLGSNGDLYVQYTAGTGGASDVVDALYVKLDGEWCEISTGGGSGSGGHVIVDEDGTSLTQRANLQFNGAYLEDNSADDTTEVNIAREMTKAEFDLLTADEKTGLINVIDAIGSGSSIVNEVIYQNTGTTNPQQINLTSAYSNYDFIIIRTKRNADSLIYTLDRLFNCNGLALNSVIQDFGWAASNNYWAYTITSETQWTLVMQGSGFYIYEVYGIKVGSNSLHTYSQNEQIIGKWVDGKTLYEKTVTTGGSVPAGATLIERIVQTGYDTIRYTKT